MMLPLLMLAMAATAQQADYSKLSGLMKTKLKEYETHAAQARRSGQVVQDEILMPLIKADSEETLTRQGVHVFDHLGNIYFTAMPISRVAELSNDEGVVRIELNLTPKSLMDWTPGIVGATNIYDAVKLPQAYTGKGVLVGISDSGFDYTHPMFQNANGTTRIRWAWDMYTGRGATEGYLGIGSLYDTPQKIAKACGSTDSLGKYHGTHVASIAVGSSVLNNKYRGIAYESDIAMFMSGTSNYIPTTNNQTLGDLLYADVRAASGNPEVGKYQTANNTGALLGIKRFFDYATQQNMPAVINCSWGSIASLYYDETLQEELFSELSKVPGHIIVTSSGNESDTDFYRARKANETLTETVYYAGDSADDESGQWLFITTKGDFKITLTTNLYLNDKQEPVSCIADSKKPDECEKITITNTDNYSTHTFGFTTMDYRKLSDGRTAWRVGITMPVLAYFPPGTENKTATMTVSCNEDYAMNGTSDHLAFSKGFRTTLADHTVSCPGTYDCVVTVGATNHRNEFTNIIGASRKSTYNLNPENRIVSWSGVGPTLDGRTKPDVCAPGFNIIAADNSYLGSSTFNSNAHQQCLVEQWTVGGRNYNMLCESGTSMSTPVVTGIIALWLQAKPNLTLAKVKETIAATSKHLDPNLTYPNNIYGHGEIDAYAGLLKILNIETAIPHLPHQQVQATLNGRTLHIEGNPDIEVTIYNLAGQKVLDTQAVSGIVELHSLPAGVYAVKIGNQGSTLIRL